MCLHIVRGGSQLEPARLWLSEHMCLTFCCMNVQLYVFIIVSLAEGVYCKNHICPENKLCVRREGIASNECCHFGPHCLTQTRIGQSPQSWKQKTSEGPPWRDTSLGSFRILCPWMQESQICHILNLTLSLRIMSIELSHKGLGSTDLN